MALRAGEPERVGAPSVPSYEGFDYQAFWRDPGRRHLDEAERRVVGRLLPATGRRILDVGCGYGRLTGSYVDRFDEVVLLDAAWSLLEQARDRWGGRVRLIAADLHALPLAPGSFDAAVLVRVLHHFHDPVSVLRHVRRALTSEATLVFSVGNKRNPRRVGRYLLDRSRPNPFGLGLEPYGSSSFGWHPRDVERLPREAGLSLGPVLGLGVLDKVAARVGALADAVPPGDMLSGPLGRLGIAPVLFAAANPLGPGPAPEEVGRWLRCPICQRGLDGPGSEGGGYRCASCRRRYPVRGGIADFRL